MIIARSSASNRWPVEDDPQEVLPDRGNDDTQTVIWARSLYRDLARRRRTSHVACLCAAKMTIIVKVAIHAISVWSTHGHARILFWCRTVRSESREVICACAGTLFGPLIGTDGVSV